MTPLGRRRPGRPVGTTVEDEKSPDPLQAAGPPAGAQPIRERIRAPSAPLRGADDLEIPPREPSREPPRFDGCSCSIRVFFPS
jgi:hypothetical protein